MIWRLSCGLNLTKLLKSLTDKLIVFENTLNGILVKSSSINSSTLRLSGKLCSELLINNFEKLGSKPLSISILSPFAAINSI